MIGQNIKYFMKKKKLLTVILDYYFNAFLYSDSIIFMVLTF